jgi:hypothetical protein
MGNEKLGYSRLFPTFALTAVRRVSASGTIRCVKMVGIILPV